MKDRLRQARIEKGLTQKQVADKVGVVVSAITNYETGFREPSIETLKKLCVLLNVSADYLIGLKDY